MSELLQLDDPEPLPSTLEYPENYHHNPGYELDERQSIINLSNYASSILDSDIAVGVQTERQVTAKDGMLRRQINEGIWTFSFVDIRDGQKHRYAWRSHDKHVGWAGRFPESADDVRARIEEIFVSEDDGAVEIQPGQSRPRLSRILAALSLR